MANNQKTIIALEMTLERLSEGKGDFEYTKPSDQKIGCARAVIGLAIENLERVLKIAKEEGE